MIVSSKESAKQLHLDKAFNLSKEVYNEFIESLIFENGKFVGAIYDGVEKELDDASSDEFWKHFGISVRHKDKYASKEKPPVIFEGYKPKRGGCKANPRWICVIRDY